MAPPGSLPQAILTAPLRYNLITQDLERLCFQLQSYKKVRLGIQFVFLKFLLHEIQRNITQQLNKTE